MKVLFLEIDHERSWAVASIGPAFIASYLRQHGHECEMLRIPFDQPAPDFVAAVRARAPQVIGVSLTSRQWQRGRAVVRAVREALDVPVIAGGLHPTFSAPDVLENPGFDYCCLGEGEPSMLEFLTVLEREGRVRDGQVKNVWVRGGARPETRAPFEPIDALPFMARDFLDERYGVVHVATQRGCPFPCTYCAARMFNELYSDRFDYGRRRSHENVLAELFEIRRTGQLNYVIFIDDTFTLHHPWVKEFCRVYAERLRVPFSLHARVETVTPDLLKRLADAGCKHVVYGVESGSERVRREIMRRPVTNQRFKDVFRWTKDVGILVTANYIIGMPGETPADIEQTLALHDELQPGDFGYFVFYPYPGTHMFKVCQDNGYLPPDFLELEANHRETILVNLPGLTREDIQRYYDRFTAVRERDLAARQGRTEERAKEDIADDVWSSAAIG